MTGHLGDSQQRFGRVVDLTRELVERTAPADILAVMIAAASADGGYLALRGRDGEFELVSCDCGPTLVDPDEIARWLRRDAPPTSAMATLGRGQAVWVSTREEGERQFPAVAALVPWVQAWVALPLVVRSEVIGVVVLGFSMDLEFGEPDRRTLESMAILCSVAVGASTSHARPTARPVRHPKR
ncbi:MAG: GAF domain-containing protein [Acidimicrobiia bacterium]